MRIWHKDLLPYLPDMQFRGQLRELVAIMHDWRDKGKTNHILINRVTSYSRGHLTTYFVRYNEEYLKRYRKSVENKTYDEFMNFESSSFYSTKDLFSEWHSKTYLKISMANLLEKQLGVGKSRITDEEWKILTDGYKNITGEEYMI